MAVDLTLMAPLRLGATIVPVMNLTRNPGEQSTAIEHSGLPFASGRIVNSRAPTVTFTTFFKTAWDLIGSKITRFTVLDTFNRTFTNAAADASGHSVSLKTGAQVFAHIDSISEGPGELLMANVTCHIVSGGALSGLEDLFAAPASVAIPTVAAEPVYHRRGSISVNGEVIPGVTSLSVDLGQRAVTLAPTDGLTYPEAVIYDGGERSISVGMDGAKDAYDEITMIGQGIDPSVIVYFREVTRNGEAKANGGSFTIANGRVTIDPMNDSMRSQTTTTININAYNTALNQDDPLAVSFAVASVP